MNKISAIIQASLLIVLNAMVTPLMAETVHNIDELFANKKVLAYIHSRPLLQKMFELGRIQDRKFDLQVDCKSGATVDLVGLVILSAIEFPPNKTNPTKGTWRARYKLSRCDEVKVYNTIFIANSQGAAPDTNIFYPGTTEADMLLLKDTMPPAIAYAILRAGQRGCKDIEVFDMYVTQPEHDVVVQGITIEGVWNELWSFRLCGQPVDVAVTFTPNPNGPGTSFNIGPP